ncbi:MAG: hypothetical protein IJV22_06285 [Bacteroidales bacterium]|nr:hypothetical protein [Bacteroidales bacterium]
MAKDWTGNGNSVYKTLGASNHTDKERQSEDYYATDPIAIDRLSTVFNIPLLVWECACGAGHLSRRLTENGHIVFSSDIVDRGCGKVWTDFLKEPLPIEFEDTDCCILTNPPYKYATEFIEHALDLLPEGQPAIFLLKTTALEGKGRWERLYRHGWLHEVYQFRERLLCAKNGDFERMRAGGGSAVSYAWFVFRKTPARHTIIKWI